MGKNKGLDPEQSIRAITLIKDAGWTPGRVGKHLGVSRNAIRNIVKRLQETGTVVRRSGMGKRGKIQESDYQLLMEIVEHGRYKNTNELTDLLNQELGLNISRTTYRRTIERLKPLMKSGLQSNGLQQEPQDHFILSGNSFVHESSDETLSDSDDEHDYSEIIKTFREHAEESFQMFKVPGIAVAIIKDGKVIYEEGIGHANDSMEAVTENTYWPIGEFAHSFIAVLAAKLVEGGQLSWTEPISTYMPEFSLNDELASRHTTMLDLLTHRTGIPYNELLVADIYPQDHALTLDWLEAQTPALVAKKLKHLPPVEPFRTHPEPNDLMYIVAIHVLESITQSSWKDQLAENVLTPLGLKNTGAHFTKLSRKDNVAKGYSYDALEGHGRNIPVQDLEPLYSPYTATKGMYSTLHDLAQWTKSLMFVDCDGSDQERVPLISRETLSNYIFAGHSVLSSSREPHFSTPLQGLGWIVNTYKGNDVCSHSSEFAGITTTCIIAPSKGCSVILLTNQQESPISRSLPWFAMDLVLNERPTCHRTTFRNWVADLAKSQIAEAHSKNALATTDDLNIGSDLDYVGTYHHDWCGVAHVERQTFAMGNPNALRMRLGLLEGNLRPSSVVGYIWELDGNAPKVLGYKTPCLYSVRLLHDRFQTSCDGRYLSLTRMELRTLKPIDKPIYFNRKLDDIN